MGGNGRPTVVPGFAGPWADEIGPVVCYVDERGRPLPALVTAIFGLGQAPSLNLVYVNPDMRYTDHHGRQMGRAEEVVHQSRQAAPGRYWTAVPRDLAAAWGLGTVEEMPDEHAGEGDHPRPPSSAAV